MVQFNLGINVVHELREDKKTGPQEARIISSLSHTERVEEFSQLWSWQGSEWEGQFKATH